MKTILFCLLIVVSSITSILGQDLKNETFYGDWYLNNKSDTPIAKLTFKREIPAGAFTKWSFTNDESLTVGSGFFEDFGNNSKDKATILKSLDYYKWTLNKDESKLGNLKITNNDRIEMFTVLYLDGKKLELRKDSTTLLTSQAVLNKKHIYYLTFSKADTTVFDKDALILSSTRLSKEFSRLELNSDSTFCYYYNIEYKTRRTSDPLKNEATAVVVEKSDKVIGKWYTRDINKNLQLTFNDKRTIDYSISSDKERFFLTRK